MILGNDKNIEMVEFAIKNSLPVLLVGHTGVGKTTIVRERAIEHKKKLIRVNLNGATTVDEFVGKYVLTERGVMSWIDGVLITCMLNGWWILIDEINAALPEILFVLHSLTDDDRCILLAEKDGEIVHPHPDFRLFATMNPSNEYAGTKDLNHALKSRFAIQLEIKFPDAGTETKILKAATKVSTEDSKAIAEFAAKARAAKVNDDIVYIVSPRETIFWAKMIEEGFSFQDAFTYAVLLKADEEDRRFLTQLYKGLFGSFKSLSKPGGSFQSIIKEMEERELGILAAEEEMAKKEEFLKEKILLDFAKAKSGKK